MDRQREKGEKIAAGCSWGYVVDLMVEIQRKTGTPNYVQIFSEQPRDFVDQSIGFHDTRETMADELEREGRYNSVSHTKRYLFQVPTLRGAEYRPTVPPTYPYAWNTPVLYGQKDLTTNNFSLSFQGALLSGDSLPTPQIPAADWSSLVSTVGAQLDGRMLVSQNLLVDLIQCVQTVNMFKKPFGSLTKLLKGGEPATFKNLAKASSSSFLEYKFGWENIYRSLIALRDVWGEVRQHQAYLQKCINLYVPLAARQSEVVSNPSQPQFMTLYGNGITIVPIVSRVERTYTFSLNLKRTFADAAWSKFDHVFARLGGREILEALWDVVPYSFVVDWFTHANRLTKQRSGDFHSRELRRVGHSVKTRWYGKLKITLKSIGYGGSRSTVFYTDEQVVQTTYQRSEGFPPSTASVGLFGNLNQTQIAEGLALIVQRL